MNDHIKELYYKAHDTSDVEGTFPQYFSATKFADLIVQECISEIRSWRAAAQINESKNTALGTEYYKGYVHGCDDVITAIKDHFGLKVID